MTAEQSGGGDGLRLVAAPPPPDPVPIAPRRVLPRRVRQIALPEPYDDFTVTAWMNAPKELWREVNSGEEARILPALMQLVTDHDLVDFDGNPYPPASERAFWDEINNDLGAFIIQAVAGQIGKLDPPKARD
jgi:hypothetical protein